MILNFSNNKQKKEYFDFELAKIKNIIGVCVENDITCIKNISVNLINSLLKTYNEIEKYLKKK